jgi:hypothetical protein
MEFIALLIGLFATIGFVAGVFRPILIARAPDEKRRIQLVDLFALVAMWQYALAFVMLMRHANGFGDDSPNYVAGFFLLILMTGLWLGLVSTMSRLAVQRAIKRFVAVALAVPTGIVATLVFFASTIAVLLSLLNHEEELRYFAMIWIGATMAGIMCRAGLNWATRPDPAPEVDGDSP